MACPPPPSCIAHKTTNCGRGCAFSLPRTGNTRVTWELNPTALLWPKSYSRAPTVKDLNSYGSMLYWQLEQNWLFFNLLVAEVKNLETLIRHENPRSRIQLPMLLIRWIWISKPCVWCVLPFQCFLPSYSVWWLPLILLLWWYQLAFLFLPGTVTSFFCLTISIADRYLLLSINGIGPPDEKFCLKAYKIKSVRAQMFLFLF